MNNNQKLNDYILIQIGTSYFGLDNPFFYTNKKLHESTKKKVEKIKLQELFYNAVERVGQAIPIGINHDFKGKKFRSIDTLHTYLCNNVSLTNVESLSILIKEVNFFTYKDQFKIKIKIKCHFQVCDYGNFCIELTICDSSTNQTHTETFVCDDCDLLFDDDFELFSDDTYWFEGILFSFIKVFACPKYVIIQMKNSHIIYNSKRKCFKQYEYDDMLICGGNNKAKIVECFFDESSVVNKPNKDDNVYIYNFNNEYCMLEFKL